MSEDSQKLVEIPDNLTVRDLADRIDASPIDVIKKLMASGVMANINQQIDFDTAAIVIAEFGYEAQALEPQEAEAAEDSTELPLWRQMLQDEDPDKLVDRPPVVTILGHVDHGKTTLLDVIRDAEVAAGEAGGITQHIGAYQIIHNDRPITFLDTPGHAAFTAMRARGAQGADIAVLVVAADDGVMPQTREALAHAKAARVPIVVALNKIDRPNANPERVKQELADVGLVPDEWEGDTIVVPVSAKEASGIEDLLEAIVLVADSTDIRANPEGKVLGTVIEGELDKTKGVLATLLVQNGTLHVGDVVIAGEVQGRVRAMFDYQGSIIKEAPPSTPVSVLGLSEVPRAGELFTLVASQREAKAIIKAKKDQLPTAPRAAPALTLDQIFEAFQAGKAQELRLVIKADVQGSLEPITNSVEELSVGDIRINVLHSATGNIGEDDVMLAAASDAIVIGFNVTADRAAKRAAAAERVDVRMYDVIYRLTEDIEKALKGMLVPEKRIVEFGQAEVLEIFRIPKIGKVAGCKVIQGEIRRGARMRVMRGEENLHEGPIASLRHEKEDVNEIREGFECGISLKGFEAFKKGDRLVAFIEETVPVE
ncbi:MAG: translation initiation factor IF-2 [Chloroflexi bacterium]|nr:translation initiation factor IF-2 [Chloroflexota bacterium]MDK1044467.1 translation initiation factor IF-2 [Anaerolineales bacterium]MCH8341092.1 translation initiation factor IF-2 [Chloroflexota bacterium]MCH8876229.1 translation initiation factor IF-2 [Chloroflexota bacterium]MCI0771901.1 translation initiation factor IF-2 [Chloroflexota bacterium]